MTAKSAFDKALLSVRQDTKFTRRQLWDRVKSAMSPRTFDRYVSRYLKQGVLTATSSVVSGRGRPIRLYVVDHEGLLWRRMRERRPPYFDRTIRRVVRHWRKIQIGAVKVGPFTAALGFIPWEAEVPTPTVVKKRIRAILRNDRRFKHLDHAVNRKYEELFDELHGGIARASILAEFLFLGDRASRPHTHAPFVIMFGTGLIEDHDTEDAFWEDVQFGLPQQEFVEGYRWAEHDLRPVADTTRYTRDIGPIGGD